MSEERLNSVPKTDSAPPAELQTPFVPPLSGCGSRRGAALKPNTFTPPQRLLLLDAWRRSGLPTGDFAPLVGPSKHTLYGWKKRFDEEGPAGLMDKPMGQAAGSRLPEITRRTILMLKEAQPAQPDWE